MENKACYKPNTVQFELVEGCNRRCSFCGTSGFEKQPKFVTPQVLKKQSRLVEESGYRPRVALVGHGEPTLHPQFFKCIKLMRKIMPDLHFQMMTNGYLIRKDLNNIKKIFDAGVNDIILDEYSDNKFDPVSIQKIVDEYQQETGRHVDFRVMGENSSLYGDKNKNKYRLLLVPPIDEKTIALSRKLTNQCGAGMPADTACSDKRCTRLFRELVYRWDGNVALCCQDFRGEYFVCNMMDESIQTLDDIWLHERMESARKITYHDGRKFYPCNICNLLPIRPGLLPDYKGQQEMENPTKKDYKIVSKVYPPLTNRVPRKWEEETGHFVNGDKIIQTGE